MTRQPGAIPRRLWAGVTLVLLLGACSPKDTVPKTTPAPQPGAPATAKVASIGSATMTADGTIVLTLRATDGAGAVGDGQLRYPPAHPQYQTILKHLDGLHPGESKPVKPFD